jgi:hypothetical protein
VAEGARLESVFTGNRNVGSNPTPSASGPLARMSLLFVGLAAGDRRAFGNARRIEQLKPVPSRERLAAAEIERHAEQLAIMPRDHAET